MEATNGLMAKVWERMIRRLLSFRQIILMELLGIILHVTIVNQFLFSQPIYGYDFDTKAVKKWCILGTASLQF